MCGGGKDFPLSTELSLRSLQRMKAHVSGCLSNARHFYVDFHCDYEPPDVRTVVANGDRPFLTARPCGLTDDDLSPYPAEQTCLLRRRTTASQGNLQVGSRSLGGSYTKIDQPTVVMKEAVAVTVPIHWAVGAGRTLHDIPSELLSTRWKLATIQTLVVSR